MMWQLSNLVLCQFQEINHQFVVIRWFHFSIRNFHNINTLVQWTRLLHKSCNQQRFLYILTFLKFFKLDLLKVMVSNFTRRIGLQSLEQLFVQFLSFTFRSSAFCSSTRTDFSCLLLERYLRRTCRLTTEVTCYTCENNLPGFYCE